MRKAAALLTVAAIAILTGCGNPGTEYTTTVFEEPGTDHVSVCLSKGGVTLDCKEFDIRYPER